MFILHILLQKSNILLNIMLLWGRQTESIIKNQVGFCVFFIAHQMRWMDKPRLTVSEARHRLAPSEGQKELTRRSKPCRKNGGNEMIKRLKKHFLLSIIIVSLLLISCVYLSFIPSAYAKETNSQEKLTNISFVWSRKFDKNTFTFYSR
jgi:hypothetical protein